MNLMRPKIRSPSLPCDLPHQSSLKSIFDEDSDDDFYARQSSRMPVVPIIPDNDIWVEHFALTKSIHYEDKTILRPYFESVSTGKRLWDEPPTGASTVQYATAHARQMADLQLEDYLRSKGNVGFISNLSMKKGIVKRVKNHFSKKNKKGSSSQNTSMDGAIPEDILFRDIYGLLEGIDTENALMEDKNEEASKFHNEELISQKVDNDIEIVKALSLSLNNQDSSATDSMRTVE